MELDHNYSVKIKQDDSYSDSFDKLIDLILLAKEEGVLSDKEAAVLLEIVIKRQNNVAMKDIFDSLLNDAKKREKQTLFVQLKTNTINYAS